MTQSNDRLQLIRECLTEAINPVLLNLTDQSQEHEGHAGAKGGGHFSLMIVSSLFKNKSAVERHRLIYAALGHLIGTEIHAVTITAKTPEEHNIS